MFENDSKLKMEKFRLANRVFDVSIFRIFKFDKLVVWRVRSLEELLDDQIEYNQDLFGSVSVNDLQDLPWHRPYQ
jgi:hypothetical protein